MLRKTMLAALLLASLMTTACSSAFYQSRLADPGRIDQHLKARALLQRKGLELPLSERRIERLERQMTDELNRALNGVTTLRNPAGTVHLNVLRIERQRAKWGLFWFFTLPFGVPGNRDVMRIEAELLLNDNNGERIATYTTTRQQALWTTLYQPNSSLGRSLGATVDELVGALFEDDNDVNVQLALGSGRFPTVHKPVERGLLDAEALSAAIIDLRAIGLPATSAQVVSEALRDALFRGGVYRILERGEMETILGEQALAMSGVCEGRECALEMGKMLNVERIVYGSVSKLGEIYSISAKVADVATGEVLGMGTVRRSGREEELLLMVDELLGQLAP